jgi:hypothetical protein
MIRASRLSTHPRYSSSDECSRADARFGETVGNQLFEGDDNRAARNRQLAGEFSAGRQLRPRLQSTALDQAAQCRIEADTLWPVFQEERNHP